MVPRLKPCPIVEMRCLQKEKKIVHRERYKETRIVDGEGIDQRTVEDSQLETGVRRVATSHAHTAC